MITTDLQKIIDLKNKGLKNSQIARIVGISRQAVWARLTYCGYLQPKKNQPRRGFPQKRCPFCQKLTKLDFDPLYDKIKSFSANCPYCQKWLFADCHN